MRDRLNLLTALGTYFQNITTYYNTENNAFNIDIQYIEKVLNQAQQQNPWFTRENILFTFEAWSKVLTKEKLEKWVASYDFSSVNSKKIGLVTAGNIPLVGLHDIISILISGHSIMLKPSSQDRILTTFVIDFLQQNSVFQDKIYITEQKLRNFDAIIATGSNNTALYFESYFGKYPHIIRKNRNAVAVITEQDSDEDLIKLSNDIFQYFGLGCRSVSKVFIPKNYDLNRLFQAFYHHKDIINHHKYHNNYDYNKAVYLMNGENLLENGFLLLKEDSGYASPISVLFYEHYDDLQQLKSKLIQDKYQIQCVVSAVSIPDSVPFGKAQQPELWDYADGVDTLQFLAQL